MPITELSSSIVAEVSTTSYVQGVACGLRARNAYQDIVEEAKAQVDDIVAEATYLTEGEAAEEETVEEEIEEAEKAEGAE